MAARQTQVFTTVQMQVGTLDAQAIQEFAELLREQRVPHHTPIQIRHHEGQRGEDQGATLTALVVLG